MDAGKKRHVGLTVWLILIIAANLFGALFLIYGIMYRKALFPEWALPFNILCAAVEIFNVVCGLALFWWKKWGFYGFLATGLFAFAFSVIFDMGKYPAIGGLLAPALIFGMLQLGKDNKGWAQLE